MGIRHSSNEHSLSFRNLQNDQKEYCDACTKEISKMAYACRCGFRLHESCASEVQHLPHKIIHPLHSQHDLELKLEVLEDFICDKCLYIFAASGYKCKQCDFSLDLACASSTNDPLPEEKWQRPQDGKKREIQHYSHLHKLTFFQYRKIRNYGYNCSWCEKCLSEVCYGCVSCKFFLRELCRDKVLRTLYHPSHPLRLHYKDIGNNCNACGQDICFLAQREDILSEKYFGNLSYCCLKCNLFLHFGCTKLLPTLKHKCHEHLVTYFRISKKAKNANSCNACGALCDYDFYRCVECNFNVHLHCVPIPSSIEHRYHRHPLNYMDSVAEDHSEEYYCDICKNERNPAHPVYCCEKCKYITHVHCVLNEVKITCLTFFLFFLCFENQKGKFIKLKAGYINNSTNPR
ncbi:Cysteine/Histidine-rich C1 domain family protein [Theobroma cacao]|uniref:Cysteine/Histidine-rich C1 domain family protein n=1 Tax=Theobroma cacao TaxID=3641 RepID=A0A061FSA5_THECC|nr:Cysteine/Histidine-rich C1 domain family protein [Theobroma cacao]